MKWESWFNRRRWEQRMEDEFRFHLESQIDDYVNQGLSREEAGLRARREFGAADLVKDECRDQRPAEWLDHMLRDVRYAGRSLRKSPGFACAAIITLALGIGATAAIFSAVHSVLLKPLPYSDPEQIYSVEVVISERRSQFASLPVTIQTYPGVAQSTDRIQHDDCLAAVGVQPNRRWRAGTRRRRGSPRISSRSWAFRSGAGADFRLTRKSRAKTESWSSAMRCGADATVRIPRSSAEASA